MVSYHVSIRRYFPRVGSDRQKLFLSSDTSVSVVHTNVYADLNRSLLSSRQKSRDIEMPRGRVELFRKEHETSVVCIRGCVTATIRSIPAIGR